jgi:hypothetical protein
VDRVVSAPKWGQNQWVNSVKYDMCTLYAVCAYDGESPVHLSNGSMHAKRALQTDLEARQTIF